MKWVSIYRELSLTLCHFLCLGSVGFAGGGAGEGLNLYDALGQPIGIRDAEAQEMLVDGGGGEVDNNLAELGMWGAGDLYGVAKGGV